jgi:tetratricopeptide (TPR) repeat protein
MILKGLWRRPDCRVMKLLRDSKKTWLAVSLGLLVACSQNAHQYLTSGESYLKAAKYAQAVVEFKNAIQKDPRLAEAHYQLAEAYLKLNSASQALRELREAVTLDPNNLDAELQMATLLMADRKYDEAKAIAEKVIAATPNNSRAHAILGERDASVHDWPGAIRELQLAITLDPAQVRDYARLAVVYFNAGQPTAAETVFKRAIEANPKSLQAHIDLGRFYFSQRRLPDAEAEMRAASQVEPGASLPRLLLADYYLAAGNLAEAEKVCIYLKKIGPGDPQAYRALGYFYRSTGQKEKAMAEFRALLTSKPKDSSAKADLIGALLDLNRVQEAAKLNQELQISNSGDAHALLSNGRTLIAEGKYLEAITALENAVKGDPQSAAGHYFLGVAQNALGLAGPAKSSFALALKLAPGTPEAEVALAEADARSGAYDEALRLSSGARQANPNLTQADLVAAEVALAKGDVKQGEQLLLAALERDPTSLPALEMLLRVYARQGKTQEAITRLSNLVSQYPRNAGLHLLLALGYFSLKDLPNSEASVRQAIEIDGRTPNAYALLARISLGRGSAEQAMIAYRKQIEVDPRQVSNYMALEGLYEKQGDWKEAEKLSERAHGIDPTSALVAANLASLYLDHGGNVNVALSLAQQAKQKMPDSAAVTDTLGWAFYKAGSPQPAVAQLTESAKKAANNPLYQYHLGMAYLAAGRSAPAALSLRQALKDDPRFAFAADARAALDKIAEGTR